MMKLSLEYLMKSEGWQDIEVWFFIDGNYHPETLKLANEFPGLKQIVVRDHNMGPTPNILEGFKQLYNEGAEIIFDLEDDMLISNDWFKFANYCLEHFADDNTYGVKALPYKGSYFNPVVVADPDETIVSLSPWWSCGVFAFRRYCVNKYLLQHCNSSYYNNRQGYLNRHFPGLWEDKWFDQDGLHQRIRAANKLRILSGAIPRASHIGVYGHFQGRSHLQDKPIEEQYRILKEACLSKEKLLQLVDNKVYSNNFWDFNPNIKPWQTLKLV